jgi:putative peptidoglycan lipid II flippase
MILNSNFVKQSLTAASLLTIGISIVNKVFGYVREAVTAGYFGTSATFDIYILAFTIPEVITSVVIMALPSALIPGLRDGNLDSTGNKADYFWPGIVVFAPIFAMLSVAIYIFRYPIFHFLASDFPGADQQLGPRLLAISSLLIFFRCMEGYFRSWLFEKKHFIVPYSSNLLVDMVILAAILLFYGKLGIESLAYGWLVASALLFVYTGVFVLILVKPGVARSLSWSWTSKIIMIFAAVVLIEFISISFPLVDRFLAARLLGPGPISALRYAFTLISIPVAVFVVSFNTASFPWISDFSTDSGREKLRKLYRESVGLIIFLMILVSIGVAIFAEEIVRIAFMRGAFDESSLILTSGPLAFFAFGITFYSIFIFQIRFYYANMQLLRLGVILGLMLLVKVVGSLILVGPLGHIGLALSSSLTWLLGFLLMTTDLGRSLGVSFKSLIDYALIKKISIAFIVGIFWFLIRFLWNSSEQSLGVVFLYLSMIGVSGICLYVVLAAIANVPEFDRISKYLPFKLRLFRGIK